MHLTDLSVSEVHPIFEIRERGSDRHQVKITQYDSIKAHSLVL